MTTPFQMLWLGDPTLLDAELRGTGGASVLATDAAGCSGSERFREVVDSMPSQVEWLVLADSSSSEVCSQGRFLADAIMSRGKAGVAGEETSIPPSHCDIWLTPWNDQCSRGLLPWRMFGSTVASYWCDPSETLAICLRPSFARRLSSETQLFDENCTSMSAWRVLIAGFALGAQIQFSKQADSAVEKFDFSQLPRTIPTLVSGGINGGPEWLKKDFLARKLTQLLPQKRSDADAVAVKAGVCLWNDWSAESHQLAQSVEGLGKHRAGDYWHAILHRREPDYSNAKYWFRQLKTHPIFFDLSQYAAALFQNLDEERRWLDRIARPTGWDPAAFVDLCEHCSGSASTPLARVVTQLQAIEMQLLLASTLKDAL